MVKLVAAALLASLAGEAPSEASIKKILGAVGAEVDAERLSKLLSELEGKDINEVVAAGVEKLASVPSGGAVAAAPAGGAAAGGAAPAAAEKKEEKVEEEEDEDMGFSLFD